MPKSYPERYAARGWANSPWANSRGLPMSHVETPYPKPYPPFVTGPNNNFASGNSNGFARGNGNWGRSPYTRSDNQSHNGNDFHLPERHHEQISRTLKNLSTMTYKELVHFAADMIPSFSKEELLQVAQYMLFVNDTSPTNKINYRPQYTLIISEPPSSSYNKTAKNDDKTNKYKESDNANKNEGTDNKMNWKSYFNQPYAHKYNEELAKFDWETNFAQLCEYKICHGDFNVTSSPSLCKWIEHQRKLYNNKKLPEDCIKRLTNVGFWINPSPKSYNAKSSNGDSSWEGKLSAHQRDEELAKFDWETNFAQLCEYKICHGDFNVTGNPSLCKWIEHQRKLYNIKKLPEDCIKRLANVGFWINSPPKSYNTKSSNGESSWEGRLSSHQRDEELAKFDWETNFSQLCEYKICHGDFNVTGNPSLCKWIEHQRKLYNNKKLPEDCIKRLANVGFWISSSPKSYNAKSSNGDSSSEGKLSAHQSDEELAKLDWETNFSQLCKYKFYHGNFNVKGNPSLCKWIERQRKLHDNEKLPEDCINRLANVGFWITSPIKSPRPTQPISESSIIIPQPQSSSQSPKDISRHNSESPSKANGKTVKIVQKKTKGKLTKNKNEPEFWASSPQESSYKVSSWERNFAKLEKYVEEKGDCNVTSGPLRNWSNQQRRLYLNNQLSKDRIDRLTRIGFWRPDQSWEYRFKQIVSYQEKHGTTYVARNDQEHPGLGEWCTMQRHLYRNGKLSVEKAQRLKDVGFGFKKKCESDDKSENTSKDQSGKGSARKVGCRWLSMSARSVTAVTADT